MKNVIKAVKKLKLWSKKKRKKKKSHEYEYEYDPLPPPCHHCCSCSSSTTQPSAPPLPPFSWVEAEVEAEHNYGTFLPPPEMGIMPMAYPTDGAVDPTPAAVYPTPSVVSSSSTSSYQQQYMVSVSEHVYGIPVKTSRRERSTGQFGCVFSFGTYLFRCLCPCFHIRDQLV